MVSKAAVKEDNSVNSPESAAMKRLSVILPRLFLYYGAGGNQTGFVRTGYCEISEHGSDFSFFFKHFGKKNKGRNRTIFIVIVGV